LEGGPEKAGVGGSIPSLATTQIIFCTALFIKWKIPFLLRTTLPDSGTFPMSSMYFAAALVGWPSLDDQKKEQARRRYFFWCLSNLTFKLKRYSVQPQPEEGKMLRLFLSRWEMLLLSLFLQISFHMDTVCGFGFLHGFQKLT
jgi:hypothetical protein